MKIFLVKWDFAYYSDQRCYPKYVKSLWTGHWYFWTEHLISGALLCICFLPFFSKPDVVFILFDMELSSKNKEMGLTDIELMNKRLVLFHSSPSLPRYLQLHQSSNLVFTLLLQAKVFMKSDSYLLKNCR